MPLSKNQFLFKRLEKLRYKLASQKLEAILISSFYNRYYLTGWRGDSESGYLLITSKQAFVITDSRYTEEVSQRVAHFELREYGQDEKFWEKLFSEIAVKNIGFEEKDLSVFALRQFKKNIKKVKWVSTNNLIETLRAQKDSSEIELIKKSVAIADRGFEFSLKNIKVGMSEKEIAFEIEKFTRGAGSEKNAWENFIVASGSNSSMVHYPAGERKIKKGDQILLDWGCYYQGYASDISRVIFMGTPNSRQAQVYNLVLTAQQKGIEQVKLGNSVAAVDLAARKHLENQTKFAFRHGVGHGVGLEVHELPRVNEKTKEKFHEGNVITVEPGIYEPGWGGVRIEDMVLVTTAGSKVLTKSPKNLDEVIV